MFTLDDYSEEAALLEGAAYERRFTLFRSGHIMSPVVYPIKYFQFPKYSIYHYVSTSGVTSGPDRSDFILRSIPGLIFIDHVTKYGSPIGNPIRAPGVNAEMLVNEYRRMNRAIRPLKSIERLDRDDRSLVVVNYAILSHLVRYGMNFRAGYYRWYNIYQEVFRQVNHYGALSSRKQFIELNLSKWIPPVGLLREFANQPTSNTFGKLRTDEDLLIADMFVWAGKNRHNSLLGTIDPKYYPKINIILKSDTRWVVMNLGWLDNFRANPDQGRLKGMRPEQFQLYLLKFLNALSDKLHAPVEDEEKEKQEQEIVANGFGKPLDLDADFDDIDEFFKNESDKELDELEKELADLETIRKEEAVSEAIDEDGNILERVAIDFNPISSTAADDSTPAIVKKAEELASKGLMTPAAKARLIRLSTSSDNLEDPYGTGKPLKEAAKIEQKDLVIEPRKLTDDPIVVDKSLTYSSVDAFEKHYIENVLKKDILSCVLAMEKAPIAITSYTVEKQIDAMNEQELHTIKMVPAVGKVSTVKFVLPVLKSDGTFKYNGTSYRMRKQRIDNPIRKISPTRVAMSSYYSKLFCDRSARSKFDYIKWLVGQIVVASNDPENKTVKDVVFSSSADYTTKLPYLYTGISGSIGSMVASGVEFNFSYQKRKERLKLTEEELKLEQPGWVACGRMKGDPVYMDPKGAVYRYTGGDYQYLAQFEELVGVDVTKAPTPMVELKLYSKSIPVGFALAYLIGLDKLIERLGAKNRRVLTGQRLHLEPNEYAIRFKNETIVLDRNDVVATLTLSGFNLYHAHLRNYDIELFNSKDVYSAVCERAGIASRYIRELDNIDVLFVDPITKGLLEMMGEPTEFTNLLLRAVDMLKDEYVPARRKDEAKLVEGMERIRGYERFAGFVYEVLSKAVRGYVSRASSGNAGISVNPVEAMVNIIQDQTTSPVNNINPIHSMREREVVTFSGRGGRSRQAMVASTRLYKPEDMGFISEATVDSGDVAIITYLSPDANLTTVRGTVRLYDKDKDGAGKLMSTPALLSPASDMDDRQVRSSSDR